MTEGIIAAIASIVVAIITLIGVIYSSKRTSDKIAAELDKNQAVMDTKFEAKLEKLQSNMAQKIDDNQQLMEEKLDSNQKLMQEKLDRQQEVFNKDIDEMKNDIKEHNHYAKLFAESMPVVQEQIKVINHRISDIENNK